MIVEIKAKIENITSLEESLKNLGAKYISAHEVFDTYFNPSAGYTTKITKIPNENILFFFEKDPSLKRFKIHKFKIVDDINDLEQILGKILGVKIKIHKARKLYNFKEIIIKIDTIKELGTFIILQKEVKENEIEETNKELLDFLDRLKIDRKYLQTEPFDVLMLKK